MRAITPALALLLLSSCARNLKEDITLDIDESQLEYSFGQSDNAAYIRSGDSSVVYNSYLRELKNNFRDKGDDVTVISSTGDYTLRILYFHIGEYTTSSTVSDPCDTSSSLTYEVAVINARMKCEVINNFTGQSEFISADAESDEDVKTHPTIFQSLIGNDSCYTPRVSAAHPEAVERRLMRRIHRYAMQAIKRWQ